MSTITFGGAVVGGAEAPVSAFGGSEIIGGLYEAVSGGVTGGASKKRASAPMKDAAGKLNVMNLQDYGNSIYAEEKEKMIRAIAKDIFNVVGANGIKNVDTADIGTVVKQLVKNIPTGSSGKRVKFNDEFNNSSGKQSSVCKRLATVINKHCGGIINMDLGESGMCDKISEVILSLVTGLHTEFMTVAGDILRVLNNMQLAQDYLTSAYQKQKELIESSGDDSLKLQSGETDKVYEEVMTEYKRQMTILSNLINVTVGPSGKVLISALENNEDFTGTVRNLKEMMGTKAFGDKLSYLLSGVSSVAHSAEIITKALKQIGFAVKDFCSVKNAGELQSKLVQFVAKSGPSSKQLDEMMKAIKLIMNADYNHEAICKLLSKSGGRGPGSSDSDDEDDEDVEGGYDGVFGGASRDELLDTFGDDDTNTVPRYANRTLERKRLDKKIDAKDRQRGLLLFEFKKQLQSLIRGVVDSANSIADKIGNTLPVSDDLKHFVTKFGALPTLDKERLHEMLSGYYKDAKTREGREKFLDQYEAVIKACENLTKGSSGSLFSSLSNSLSKVVDAVDTFSDKIVKAITEIHIDRPGEIEAKLRETAARFYGGGESGDDLFGSGSWVELDTVRTVMKYRLSIANIKTNLARTTQDLREYTSDYEQILGEESAWLIDTVKKQFMSRINIDITKRPPVGTATAVAKTWTELHIINKNDASNGKEAFESLRTLWTFQMNAKINMIKAAQAVDMYLKSFTNGMSKNPDSIGSIVKMLSEVEHVAKWFTEKSGDNLASLFDVFPASLAGGSTDSDYLGGTDKPVEASGSCKIPFGDATLSHYYLYVSQQYAADKLPGNPFLGRPLSGDKTASKQCRGIIMLSKKVIKTMRALENILSAFSSVGSKFGDVTPAADTFMTPGQIFNALCDYVAASAFTNEFTSNLGDNRFDFSYMTDLNDPKRGTVTKDQYKELKPAAVQTVAIYNNGDNLIPNDLRKENRMGRLNRVETGKFSDATALKNEFAPQPPPPKKDMTYLIYASDRARNSGNEEYADTLESLINEIGARAGAKDYAAYKKSNDAAVADVKKLAGDLRTDVDNLNTTVTAVRSDATKNFDALTKILEEINNKSKEFSTSVGLLLSVDGQLIEITDIEGLRAKYDATPTSAQVNAVYTAGQTALRLDYGSTITDTNAKIADDALMGWLTPRKVELKKLKALMDVVATPLPAMVKSADDAAALAAAVASAAAKKVADAEVLAALIEKFNTAHPNTAREYVYDIDREQNPKNPLNPKPKRRGNSISFRGEIPLTGNINFNPKPEPEPENYGVARYGINSNGVLWYGAPEGARVVVGSVTGSVDLVPIYVTNTLFNGRDSMLCLSTSADGPPTEFTLDDGEVYDSFNTSDGILTEKIVKEENPHDEEPYKEPYKEPDAAAAKNGFTYDTGTGVVQFNGKDYEVDIVKETPTGDDEVIASSVVLTINPDNGAINIPGKNSAHEVLDPTQNKKISTYDIENNKIIYAIPLNPSSIGGGFSGTTLGSELGIKVGTLAKNKFTSLALAGLPTAGYGSSVSEYHKWEDDPENKPKMLMSGWRDMFADTDMLYQMTVKSVVAKIFTAVDAFRLFHRPVDNVRATYSLNPVRSILGGADGGADAPKVRIIPEAVELYYRLVLLAEWYRDIFGVKSKDASALQGASTDAWRVTIVPNLDGVWSEFVSLVFDKAEYVKDGNYSDAQVRGLVRCINEIWNTYKSKHPTSTTRHILNSFVLEMNRSFGFLRQDDIQKYIERSLDQQRMGDDGDDDLVIYDILGAENSYGSRPAPSDKFSSVNGQRKTTRTTSSMVFLQEAIGNLRKKIDVQFMNLGKSDNYVSQFTDTLDQYKKSVSIAKSDSESFKVVANMLQKADAKISANVDQYMMLYESVVVPLNVLSMVYNMLDTFNNRCHGLSIENMRKYKAGMGVSNDITFKKDYKEFLEKQYRCDASYKPYLENFAETLSNNMTSCSIAKDKTLNAGTDINFAKVMKLLLQTMLDIGANQSKLIEVTVSSNGTINIDFGTITDLCTKLLSTVKSNCKKLRNLPGGINTIVDKFETLSDPKSNEVKTTRDFEEHLINKLCGNKYNMGLAAALVHLRNTFDAITNQYKDAKTGSFGSSRDVSDSTCRFVDTADQSVAALIYYDQTVAASLAASTGAAGGSYFVDNMVFPGNVVALTKNLETTEEKSVFNGVQTDKLYVPKKYTKFTNPLLGYAKLHQMPIITFTNVGGVDGPKGLLDFNKNSNSLFFAFNTAVMQYLNTTVDDNALKTYAPLFDQYVSGPGALEVIQKRGFPNVRDIAVDDAADIALRTAVDTLGGLSADGGVLYNSNAIIIRSLLNTSVQTSSATRKRFLYDNLLEMPEFLKDRLKTNLPLFVKIFSSIADRADLLRGLLQNTNLKSIIVSSQKGTGLTGIGTNFSLKSPGLLADLTHDLTATPQKINDTAQMTKYYSKLLSRLSESARSLRKCADVVYRELQDKPPVFFETSRDFLEDYAQRMNARPFMPYSLITAPLCDVNPDTRDLNKIKTLFPGKDNGTPEFKYKYATRSLLNQNVNFTLDHFPGSKLLYNNYAQLTSKNMAISPEEFTGTVQSTCTLMRFIQNGYQSAIMFNGEADNSKYLYKPGKGDTFLSQRQLDKVVELVENTTSANASEQVATSLATSPITSIAGNSRLNLQMYNILDADIVPLNVHAFMREVPFANLINYSYTFDRMIVDFLMPDFYDTRTKELNKYNVTFNQYSVAKTRREMLAKLLIYPFVYCYKGVASGRSSEYFTHVRGLFNGDDDLQLGRPKYLSDQLWHKVLLSNTVDTTNNLYGSNGALLRRIGAPATSGHNSAIGLQSRVSSKASSTRAITGPVSNADDSVYMAELGKMRFDTKLVRNLVWFVQLQRVLRVVLISHLSWINTPVVRGLKLIDPKITEYDNDDTYEDDEFSAKNYKLV